MNDEGMLTKFAYCCELCGIAVFRYKTDDRPLPPVGDRECGMCGLPRPPPEELVKVGECRGCGAGIFKPAHRRGRNAHYCPACRVVGNFAPPRHKGENRGLAPKINARGPPVAPAAVQDRGAGPRGRTNNERVTRIKAVLGGKTHGRGKGDRRR